MDLQELKYGMYWIDLTGDRDRVAGFCECGNEHLCSLKVGEFYEYLWTC